MSVDGEGEYQCSLSATTEAEVEQSLVIVPVTSGKKYVSYILYDMSYYLGSGNLPATSVRIVHSSSSCFNGPVYSLASP